MTFGPTSAAISTPISLVGWVPSTLLAFGTLGSGPRTWLGGNATPIHTLTVMDLFGSTGKAVLTTYDMTTLRPIRSADLPRRIVTPSVVVVARQGG